MEYLWPIVREMVKTAIENKQNLIVEGCYIPPAWRKDFEEEYLRSIDAFKEGGEKVTLIESDYEETIGTAPENSLHISETLLLYSLCVTN